MLQKLGNYNWDNGYYNWDNGYYEAIARLLQGYLLL